MYAWRQMTPAQREAAVQERQLRGMPLHGPPHFESDYARLYHLTAACYEHRAILGYSPARMAAFEGELIAVLLGGELVEERPPEGGTTNGCGAVRSPGFSRNLPSQGTLRAWCVLPTHWHALVHVADLPVLTRAIGRLHGRSSHRWNTEEDARGRTCWHRCADRAMRTEAHVCATVNYILHNPVHHGYVARWQEWPYSNAREYLAGIGEVEAARRWKVYPVMDYGKGWDEPGM